MKSSFAVAHGALLLKIFLLAGANNAIPFLAPEYLPASVLALFRIGATMVVLGIIKQFLQVESVAWEDYGRLALCALFGIGTGNFLLTEGMAYTNPVHASLLFLLAPVFLVVQGMWKAGNFDSRKMMGVLIGGIACLLMFGAQGRLADMGGHSWYGISLLLISVLGYVAYLILLKPLVVKYHPVSVIFAMLALGFWGALPFCYQQFVQVEWSALPLNVWGTLAFLVFFATVATYLLNFGAMRVLSPTDVGIYVYIGPLFTGLIGCAWSGATMPLECWAAGLGIIYGGYLVCVPKGWMFTKTPVAEVELPLNQAKA